MTPITVRAGEPRDAEAIYEILCCPGVIAGTLKLPYQSFEEFRERLTTHTSGHYRLVAEIDGRVVGDAGLHLEEPVRRRHCASLGMSVHDDFRGRGVGN